MRFPLLNEVADWVTEPVFELKGRFIQVDSESPVDGYATGKSFVPRLFCGPVLMGERLQICILTTITSKEHSLEQDVITIPATNTM